MGVVRWLGFAGLWLCAFISEAQAIRGRVLDASTSEPLFGATVRISDTELGSITDTAGYYQLLLPTAGVFSVSVSYLGFQQAVYPEVWVKNQGTTSLDVNLNPSFSDLQAITISERREVSAPGRLVITEEQIGRFASTYYDPARMATTVPDVAVTNDQNNRITVRGIPPAYNIWRLEGAEILNPNHLSNAGTFSDQPTSSGGGVNILSAQMMSNSSFLYGHMTSGYNNTVGGLFDMQMKVGNTEENQYVAQASFIGFDFAVDGPISKAKGATFAMNYRYSFTGLLTAFGVDFGGERIGFQDLSFSMNFPVNENTSVKVFGLGGLNFNKFDGVGLQEAETEKDLYNIDFTSGMGAIGSAIKSKWGLWQMSDALVYSGMNTERDQRLIDPDPITTNENILRNHFLISNHAKATRAHKRGLFTAGLLSTVYLINNKSSTDYISNGFSFSYPVHSRFSRILNSPYVESSWNSGENATTTIGVSYYNLDGLYSRVDPRLRLDLKNGNVVTSFSAGRYSQVYNPGNFIFILDQYEVTIHRKFIQSTRFIVDVIGNWKKSSGGLSLFHYSFPKVQITTTESAYSSRSGFTLFFERTLDNDFYFRAGLTGYNQFLSGDVKYRFSNVLNTSLSVGKNWSVGSGKLGVNARMLAFKGLDKSENAIIVIDQYDYFRVDFRVIWTKTKKRRSNSLSLDIQNTTNRQNVFYKFYDAVQNQPVTHYQLGLIPILTYRVDF